jgi:hypothetical protein
MKCLVLAAVAALSFGMAVVACGGGAGSPLDGGTSDASGNGRDFVIEAKDFDRSCSTGSDCVAVTSGDTCALCACANDAIAKRDLDAFNARRDRLKASCPPRPGIGCSGNCVEPAVSCSSEGKCVFGTADAGTPGRDGG